MKVKFISAKLKTGYNPEKTRPDRRFKKGYRVIEKAVMTFSLALSLSNDSGRFRIGDTLRTQWGLFRVISSNALRAGGQIDLISVYAWSAGNDFEFTEFVDVSIAASVVGEGNTVKSSSI